jgi:hypothetical protein
MKVTKCGVVKGVGPWSQFMVISREELSIER